MTADQKKVLLRLHDQLRSKAPAGATNSVWDVIFDIEALLESRSPFEFKSPDECIRAAELHLAKMAQRTALPEPQRAGSHHGR